MAVRGKPSRMKEALGEAEAVAVAVAETEVEGEGVVLGVGGGEREVLGGSQFLDLSSARMRRRIISSGTRLPDFMASSASRPGVWRRVRKVGFGGGGILEVRGRRS